MTWWLDQSPLIPFCSYSKSIKNYSSSEHVYKSMYNCLIIFRRSVNKTGVAGQIISENVIYSFRTGNITRIRALDLDSNFTGGFASIVSGGVGYENVTLRFQSSAVGRGYNFFIDIYGR